MRLPLMLLSFVVTLTACEIVPSHVESSDIDDAVARELYKTVCKGLEMKDPDVRRYAAEKLSEIDEPIAVECVCEYGYDATKHSYDIEILNGLRGSERDDLAECFTPALEDTAVEARTELVAALAATRAPGVKARMKTIAASSEADDVRSAAIKSMGGSGDAEDVSTLVKLLSSDSSPTIRAAAASALVGQKDQAAVDALVGAVTADAEGTVRAAALSTVRSLNLPESDEMICKAMLEDESPEVRTQAVMSYRGTKRDEAVACLRKKAFQKEEDGGVRAALLKVLGSSPNKNAPVILCDAIPFYMKTYITDAHPERVPGTDIAKAQNDRDWENSYACFQKSLRNKSGWSCKGKQYVAAWYREVGGKGHVPTCPGDDNHGQVVFQ